MRTHIFEIGGGSTVTNGKSDWPVCLTLQMSRDDAWELVQNLINQLRGEENTYITYSSCGTINIDDNEVINAQCEYYAYQDDKSGETAICFCSHPQNKNGSVGNCAHTLCPINGPSSEDFS